MESIWCLLILLAIKVINASELCIFEDFKSVESRVFSENCELNRGRIRDDRGYYMTVSNAINCISSRSIHVKHGIEMRLEYQTINLGNREICTIETDSSTRLNIYNDHNNVWRNATIVSKTPGDKQIKISCPSLIEGDSVAFGKMWIHANPQDCRRLKQSLSDRVIDERRVVLNRNCSSSLAKLPEFKLDNTDNPMMIFANDGNCVMSDLIKLTSGEVATIRLNTKNIRTDKTCFVDFSNNGRFVIDVGGDNSRIDLSVDLEEDGEIEIMLHCDRIFKDELLNLEHVIISKRNLNKADCIYDNMDGGSSKILSENCSANYAPFIFKNYDEFTNPIGSDYYMTNTFDGPNCGISAFLDVNPGDIFALNYFTSNNGSGVGRFCYVRFGTVLDYIFVDNSKEWKLLKIPTLISVPNKIEILIDCMELREGELFAMGNMWLGPEECLEPSTTSSPGPTETTTSSTTSETTEITSTTTVETSTTTEEPTTTSTTTDASTSTDFTTTTSSTTTTTTPKPPLNKHVCYIDSMETGKSSIFDQLCSWETPPFKFRRYNESGLTNPIGSDYYMSTGEEEFNCRMSVPYLLNPGNEAILHYYVSIEESFPDSSCFLNFYGDNTGEGELISTENNKNWSNSTLYVSRPGTARFMLDCDFFNAGNFFAVGNIFILADRAQDCPYKIERNDP